MSRNSKYWMGQTDWFIDNAGSREATGADASHPIPEVERQFRMGPNPEWTANAYHLRYLTDTTSVVLAGSKRPNSTIFLHGSATDSVGQSTLYSGTITALTALNYATNQPWDLTSSGLTTSWTADGVLNKRIRLTSGTTGAKGFSLKDLTGKKARCGEFTVPGTYTAPITIPFSSASPASGNTFVVERLTKISRMVINLQSRITPGTFGVVLESLDVGADYFYGNVSDSILMDGCIHEVGATTGNVNGFFSSLTYTGCLFTGLGIFPRSPRIDTYGCSVIGPSQLFAHAMISFSITRMVSQGTSIRIGGGAGFNDNGPSINGQLGVFDSTSRPCVLATGDVVFQNSGGILWGSGNTQAALHVRPAGRFMFSQLGLSKATNFPITTSAVSDVILGRSNRTSVECFDSSLGIYTPARLLSWDNLMAEVQNGGFCQTGFPGTPNVVDALTGAAFMAQG